MTKKNVSKNIIIFLTNITFIIFFLLWDINYYNNGINISDYNNLLFYWIIISALLQIFCFKIKNVSVYDFGVWYIILSYIFMFGFIFINVFKLKTNLLWNPISYYSPDELFKAYSFALISIDLFCVGYICNYDKNNSINKDLISNQPNNKKLYYSGMILIIIGGISKIINDLRIIIITQKANSYSAFSDAIKTSILDDFGYMCLPGLFFMLYSGYLSEKNKKKIYLFFLIYFVLMMILTGSRKAQVFSILVLILGYNFTIIKNINYKSLLKTIVYIILITLLLNIIVIIRDNRFDLSSILPIFIDNLTNFKFLSNIFGEIFAETGLTLLSIASIIKVVPNVLPYQYGFTFIRTLPSIFPIGWLVGDFFAKASSTNIINTYTHLPVGSSFIGDLYWNWGYIGGAIASFIFGIISSKILKIKSNNLRIEYALYFSYFSQLIILVRAELFDIFRSLFIIFLISIIIKKNSIKKGVKYE